MGRKPPKKQPRESRGLAARREQAEMAGNVAGGPLGAISSDTAEQRSRERLINAVRRQERVAMDKPAVRGSLRPSEIRAKAKKPRAYTNDAAHGETIAFPPSEKTQRQRRIGY